MNTLCYQHFATYPSSYLEELKQNLEGRIADSDVALNPEALHQYYQALRVIHTILEERKPLVK